MFIFFTVIYPLPGICWVLENGNFTTNQEQHRVVSKVCCSVKKTRIISGLPTKISTTFNILLELY